MADAAKEKKPKVKRPTAQKRDIQNEKKRLVNKVFKSRVRTAFRSFEEALTTKDKTQIDQQLRLVYSLMDKGVKRGVLKKNTANRTKSRAVARVPIATP